MTGREEDLARKALTSRRLELLSDQVQVMGALREGDQVIVTGLSSLTPGQPVEVLQ